MQVEDPILRDCSIYCDVTTMLTQDIQNSSVAKDVSPYSSYSNIAFHFLLKTKIHLLPFYSAYTLIVEFTVKCLHTWGLIYKACVRSDLILECAYA